MLYGSETWPTKIEDIGKIQRSEMRMLRWMAGVNLNERKSNKCVRSMLAIDDIGEVMQRNRLRWFGHVERRDELCWIKRIETQQVDGNGVKGDVLECSSSRGIKLLEHGMKVAERILERRLRQAVKIDKMQFWV